MINWSIKTQIKEVASLLLKIEKKKIVLCIKICAEKTLSRIATEKNGQELCSTIKRKLSQVNLLTPMISSVDSPHNEKKMIVKHKVKKITDSQNPTRLSYFINPPNTVIKKSMLIVTTFILLALIPRIVNFSYLIQSYTMISGCLTKMYTLTAASQSVQTLLSIYWREYKQLAFTGKKNISYTEQWILENSEGVFQEVGTLNDEFIRKKMDSEKLCNYSVPFIIGPNSKSPYIDLCNYMTRLRPNITVMETYHLIRNYQMVLRDSILKNSTLINFKDFKESQETAFADVISYFLMVALRAMSSQYSDLVGNTINQNETISSTYLAISSLLLLFLLFSYFKWWIPYRLKKWKAITQCFSILNSVLVNNEYIKSYFKFSADHHLDLYFSEKGSLEF